MKIIRPMTVTNAVLNTTNITEADYSAYSAGTNYAAGDRAILVNPTSTVTISIASPGVITWAGHGLNNGAVVVFTTTGSLPTGITVGTEYYVVSRTAHTFKISSEVDGTPINTSGSQSGTHTATARVHDIYEFATPVTATVTMTIASPCVVTWTTHGLADGDPVVFTTTGALPTGLTASTVYYVLSPTTSTFNVAATPNGTAINTSGTQSGTHTARSAKQPLINYGTGSQWLRVGSTNRWKMFDSANSSQSSNTSTISVTLNCVGRINSLALLNISAASVTVTMTDAVDGLVYNTTTSLIEDVGESGWYAWLFDPIERKTQFSVTSMPTYSSPVIQITLTDTGNTVLCGNCVLGQSKELGSSLHGSAFSIQDYSVKDTDEFGVTTIVQRDYASRGNFIIKVDNTFLSRLKNLLAEYRATPIVYIGSDDYDATIIYGIYRDVNVEISYPTVSICTLDLLGLT